MFRKLVLIVLMAALICCYRANGQLVNNNFESLEIAENFESNINSWTIVSNSDNLFVIQSGEYLLNRKSIASPYAIISGIDLKNNPYKISTSLNLKKATDDKSCIGFMFALQDDKRGGYLIEINKSSQYRVRQLAGSDYIYLTGSEKNGGWEKSDAVFGLGTANIIEIRTADHNFDLYINSKFIKSITNKVYTTGSFGFIIGPGSKGSIDFIHVYVHDDGANATQQGSGADVAGLAQSIISLKTEVNKLKEENEVLRKTINAVKSETQNFDGEQNKLKEQLAAQQRDYNVLMRTNDSLIKANGELMKYKEMIAGNDNGDLVINLSKSLKAEKEKTTSLQLENKKLKEALNNLQQQGKTSTPQINETKKSDDFILPK